jgi:hypothetical protein
LFIQNEFYETLKASGKGCLLFIYKNKYLILVKAALEIRDECVPWSESIAYDVFYYLTL